MTATYSPVTFVCGHSRSGTTLLARKLELNFRFVATPETHFFYVRPRRVGLCKGWVQKKISKEELRDILQNNKRLEDLPTMKAALLEYLEEGAADFLSFAELFEKFKTIFLADYGVNGDRFLEKSPGHLLLVEELAKAFPDAQFVIIVRGVADVVRSMLSVEWAHNNRLRHVLEWKHQYKEAIQLEKALPERVSIVFYEDLVRDEVSVLAGLKDVLRIGEARASKENTSLLAPAWEAAWKNASLDKIDQSKINPACRRKDPKTDRIVKALRADTSLGFNEGVGVRVIMSLYRFVRSCLVLYRVISPKKNRYIDKIR